MPFLDKEGLAHFWNQIIARLNGKVEREEFDSTVESLRDESLNEADVKQLLNMTNDIGYIDAGTITEGVDSNG